MHIFIAIKQSRWSHRGQPGLTAVTDNHVSSVKFVAHVPDRRLSSNSKFWKHAPTEGERSAAARERHRAHAECHEANLLRLHLFGVPRLRRSRHPQRRRLIARQQASHLRAQQRPKLSILQLHALNFGGPGDGGSGVGFLLASRRPTCAQKNKPKVPTLQTSCVKKCWACSWWQQHWVIARHQAPQLCASFRSSIHYSRLHQRVQVKVNPCDACYHFKCDIFSHAIHLLLVKLREQSRVS